MCCVRVCALRSAAWRVYPIYVIICNASTRAEPAHISHSLWVLLLVSTARGDTMLWQPARAVRGAIGALWTAYLSSAAGE